MVDRNLDSKRLWKIALPVMAATALVSGCVSSPTYGTGKAADQQLLEDVTGILDLGGPDRERIDYKPRPEIVKPTDATVLPPPVDTNVTASPDWPMSPEQRVASLRAEATENRDKIGYRPKVYDSSAGTDINSAAIYDDRMVTVAKPDQLEGDGPGYKPGKVRIQSAAAQEGTPLQKNVDNNNAREEFNKRLAMRRQGSPEYRRYLSEPPVDYRVPASTAPQNDVGEDEWRKEKRLKVESRKKAGKTSWRDFVPWL